MIHTFTYVPLRQARKDGSFWKDHPEHGVHIFNAAFLIASHRGAVVNMGPSAPVRRALQAFGISELLPTVC